MTVMQNNYGSSFFNSNNDVAIKIQDNKQDLVKRKNENQ